MKKVVFIVFSTVILLSLCISAYAERKRSFEVPAGAVIPPKASVAIKKYEKTLPIYGECSGDEASYIIALSAFDINMTQEDIHKASGLKKIRGCYSDDLYYASMNLGIDVESYVIRGLKSKKERLTHLNDLKYFISQGYPVVISWEEDPKKLIDGFCSMVVVVAYDDEREEITVVDPFVGTISGRIFSYKEFINHWQWDNSDGTYSLFMDVIKGKLEDPKSRLKTIKFRITEGETVEFIYDETTEDVAFFILNLSEDEIIVSIDILDQDRTKLNKWIINDEDSPNFNVWGGGVFYFHFTSLKDQGDISITYEYKDGDLILKK